MPDSLLRRNLRHSTTFATLLQQGATGPDVIQLQRLLAHHGFNPGPIDGRFGTRTQLSLHRFQVVRGLDLTDGVDVNTWQCLSAIPA
jgi:peptidoglycan hydrolase-like protein with peptidoglycan-binding domain